MAFIAREPDFDELKRLIAEKFPADERDAVYSVVEPFLRDSGMRLASCILHLSRGSKANVEHYAECARQDYRDVLFWAENPREAAIDTPAKIQEFQRTLEWLGLQRDPELDEEHRRLIAQQILHDSPVRRRPWWRFW